MSTGVSDQRMRGQGSQANGQQNKEQLNDHEDFSSWRNQSIQNSYVTPAVAPADPYLSSYYGASFPYQLDHGAWSSTAPAEVPFYQQQQSYGVDGMFGAAGFSHFGQPTFGQGYGAEYSTWERKAAHYDDYYQGRAVEVNYEAKQVEQGMQGLALDAVKPAQEHQLPPPQPPVQSQSQQQPKKLTWASIASQPAKPQLAAKKRSMVPPPMVTPRTPSLDIGTWDGKNGSPPNNMMMANPPPPIVPAAPIVVQQPVKPVQQPVKPVQQPVKPVQQPVKPVQQRPVVIAPVVVAPPAVVVPAVLEELQLKHIYNPKEFDLSAKNARFFVIKSYSEDDIHRSIKYEIWCSTEHGNKRLDAAFRERDGKGPVYLYFSVNGSGHFCGMAEMTSAVDMSSTVSVWSQDKWRGQFTVKWIYVKDVPNSALRHIRLENNENKPVTNSRDTQEVPVDKGQQVLKILHTYRHATSIFDDFSHYEKRQAEEDQRKTSVPSPTGRDYQDTPPSQHRPEGSRGDRETGARAGDRNEGRGERDNYHRQERSGGFERREDFRNARNDRGGGGGNYDYRDRDGYNTREREGPRDRDGPRERDAPRDGSRRNDAPPSYNRSGSGQDRAGSGQDREMYRGDRGGRGRPRH